MTVADALTTLCGDHYQEIWPKARIIGFIIENCNVNPDNIRLSVFCYNRIMSDERAYDEWPKLLEMLPDTEYRLLGAGFPYTGNIYYRPEDSIQYLVVGHSNEGHVTLDDHLRNEFDLRLFED